MSAHDEGLPEDAWHLAGALLKDEKEAGYLTTSTGKSVLRSTA